MHIETKPHVQYSGGIYQITKELTRSVFSEDFLYNNSHKYKMTHIIAWLNEERMKDLVGAYHWWKNRNARDARITDNMIFKRANAYTFTGGGLKYPTVVNTNYQGYDIFVDHLDSRFSQGHIKEIVGDAKRRAANSKQKWQAENFDVLVAAGYCRISNKSQTVARIDREDWASMVGRTLDPRDPFKNAVQTTSRADTYRRCISEDKLHIHDEYLFKSFPGSALGPDMYFPFPTKG